MFSWFKNEEVKEKKPEPKYKDGLVVYATVWNSDERTLRTERLKVMESHGDFNCRIYTVISSVGIYPRLLEEDSAGYSPEESCSNFKKDFIKQYGYIPEELDDIIKRHMSKMKQSDYFITCSNEVRRNNYK